jgi:hypothetical protein
MMGPLRTAVENDHRSVANMAEVLIRNYCGKRGVTISEQGTLFNGG